MAEAFSFSEHPHRRFNPLQRSWVLCSPHRTKRPWLGAQEASTEDRPYDPKNYLLPGATRTSGDVNPDYKGTFAFSNDFAALLPDTPLGHVGSLAEDDLCVAESVRGECRVICFHNRHDLTLAEMTDDELKSVVEVWTEEYRTLKDKDHVNYAQMFENKGQTMGCSNPHPHGQIWCTSFVPDLAARSLASQQAYYQRHGRLLLEVYAQQEAQAGTRVICANATFMALVPFWAVWPYEAMVLPCPGVRLTSLLALTPAQTADLANIMRRLCCRFDNVFGCSFPYTMGIHQAPTDGGVHDYQQLHLLYYPPLLRSATVRKFMVGFEMLGEAQRDITAEDAAKTLRQQPETHYRHRLTDQEYQAKYLAQQAQSA